VRDFQIALTEVPFTTKWLWVVYPFHTLATNRILNTVISRKISNRSMVSDWKDLWSIGGFNAIYAGFVPAMAWLILGTT
jgi:hypothetical protein